MIFNFKFKLYYWPILSSLWLAFTYISTYFIAVYRDNVSPMFPYISDTATNPWESCYFAQMHNIGALFILISMFIRYNLIELYFHEGQISKRAKKVNRLSLYFGFLGCLGMSMVGNFQESNQITTHLLGALFAFLCTSIYFLIQTCISWKTDISIQAKLLRTIISALLIPFYVSTIVAAMVAVAKFKGPNVLKWKFEDGGYYLHLVSTFSEWILVGLMLIYIIAAMNLKKYNSRGSTSILKRRKMMK